MKRGTYPADIIRRRRYLGLPITPAEFLAYERGDLPAPEVTPARIAEIMRRIAPHTSPYVRAVWLEVAARIQAGQPIPPDLREDLGALWTAVKGMLNREPGAEG